ncbi:MAG: ATP-binding protein [Gammaproteobacteria bacterium]
MEARIFHTSVFRLSLLYAALFSLVAGIALSFIYWSMASRFEEQTDARLTLETDVLLNEYRRQRLPAFSRSLQQRNREDGRSQIFFYQLIAPEARGFANPLRLLRREPNRTYLTLRLGDLVEAGGQRARDPVRVLVTDLRGGYRLAVGRDLADQQALLRHTFWVIVAAITAILVLALTGGALMGYRVVQRIDDVRNTAGEIIDGDLSKRMPVDTGQDEFDQLNRRLNAMLDRIEQLMRGMRGVSDNIAHDLRNPLNRLRNRLEVTLLEARDESDYRAVLEEATGDVDDLIKTFNALLSIAQAEAGVRRAEWSSVDLGEMAEDMVDLYSAAAEEKNIRLSLAGGGRQRIQGNRHVLAQALSNLLDNAIKYTPAGGAVELSTTQLDGKPAVIVCDSGPGIPAQDRDHALQRFVRLDASRSTPGNGLGLSLVNAVARLHEASLVLEDNQPGLRVVLRFDCQEKDSSHDYSCADEPAPDAV